MSLFSKTLRMRSSTSHITEVEQAFEQFASRFMCNADKKSEMLVTIYEALNNAINHGNRADESKIVKVAFKHDRNRVCIRVSDQGEGFNPSQLADPTCDQRLCTCGGRGVFLMQQLSDSLHYKDNGRTVEMVFKLS
jgi:serine/threonine-protein kinase RsbW